MKELMPVRATLNVAAPFLALPLNVLAYLASVFAPQQLLGVAIVVSQLVGGAASWTGRSSSHREDVAFSSHQAAINDLVLSVDLALVLFSIVLVVVNLFSYRRHIERYVRYRFGRSTKELFASQQGGILLAVALPLVLLTELVFGRLTLEFFELNYDGSALPFARFLYRATTYFLFVTPALMFGLAFVVMRIMAKPNDEHGVREVGKGR